MEMSKSQIYLVLEHLLTGQPLNTQQAWLRWGVTRLADKIYELRTRYGFKIDTEMISDGTVKYAQYKMRSVINPKRNKRGTTTRSKTCR
jgi:hypothetical protein